VHRDLPICTYFTSNHMICFQCAYINCRELHALYYCYSLTQPVWYSAGMMQILLHQMAVMLCTIRPGGQLVSTSLEDFATHHLTPVTQVPSLSEWIMYVCASVVLTTYSLVHREKSNYKDCESYFPLLFQPMEKFQYGCVSISHQIYNTACSLHLHLVISTFYTTLSQQLYNGWFEEPKGNTIVHLTRQIATVVYGTILLLLYIVKILGIRLLPNTFTMLQWNKQLLSLQHFFLWSSMFTCSLQ